MAKTPIYPLRLDEDQRARWEAAAKRDGVTLATFIRDAGDVAAGGRPARTNPTQPMTTRARTAACIHRLPPDRYCGRCDP